MQRTPRPDGLARCVGDVDRFLDDAWTRRPHLHRSGADLSDLLSLDDVDRIITTTAPRPPAIRLVREGRTLPRASYTRRGRVGGQQLSDLPEVGRILALIDEGATLVLQGVHRTWEPVAELCRDLEAFLSHPVQANAYLTPPVATGLNVHHDTHDVFALQTHGSKQWLLYDPVVDTPVASQGWSASMGEPGDPAMDVTLRPGDCLYVPRGALHAARTTDEPSLHLTIGVRAVTWLDLLSEVTAGATDEVGFRQALPVGFDRDPERLADAVAQKLKELSAWVGERDPDELAGALARGARTRRRPHLRGHLHEVLRADRIGLLTEVSPRADVDVHLDVRDGRLLLELGDRTIDLPAAVEPVVRRLLTTDGVVVDDLHELDGPSRIVLVRRLVREGLLVVTGG